jgi:hypothetical protein
MPFVEKISQTIDLRAHVQPQGAPPAPRAANPADSFLTGTPVKRSSLLSSLSDVDPPQGVTKTSRAKRRRLRARGLGESNCRGIAHPRPLRSRSPVCDRDSERGAETWERHGTKRNGQMTTAARPRRGATGRGMQRRRDSSGCCFGRAVRPERSRPGRAAGRKPRRVPPKPRRPGRQGCPLASRPGGPRTRVPSRHQEPPRACPSTGHPGRAGAGTCSRGRAERPG